MEKGEFKKSKEKERVEKDLEKLEKALRKAKELFKEKYKEIIELAKHYKDDALYYYKKGDYFTAFGCLNYG